MRQSILLAIIGIALVATAAGSRAAGPQVVAQAIPSGASPLPSPSASSMAR